MKPDIHPPYGPALVVCACGNTFQTQACRPEIRVEVCSACHPFFTGKQKIVDTEGRVERFMQRYARYEEARKAAGGKAKPARPQAGTARRTTSA